MKQFKGRVVVPGTATLEALVSHGGFNTLASFKTARMVKIFVPTKVTKIYTAKIPLA